MDDAGVRYSIYDKSQIRQLEPGLQPIYEHAVLVDDTCGVSNPAKLTDAYVELFKEAGGTVLEDSITGLTQAQVWEVSFNQGNSFMLIIISFLQQGHGQLEIASWLGYDIPMLWERGYHRHLEPAKAELKTCHP